MYVLVCFRFLARCAHARKRLVFEISNALFSRQNAHTKVHIIEHRRVTVSHVIHTLCRGHQIDEAPHVYSRQDSQGPQLVHLLHNHKGLA